MNKIKFLAIVAMLSISLKGYTQGSLEQYNRAYSMKELYSADKVFYSNVTPSWIGESSMFWYIQNAPEGKNYIKVDVAKKSKEPLFDQTKLAAALSEKLGRDIDAHNLQLSKLRVDDSCQTLYFQLSAKEWSYNLATSSLEDKGAIPVAPKQRYWMEYNDEKDGEAVESPDKKYIAYIKNDNIYVKEISSGIERQLSLDGTMGNYYSSYIRWSPDSKFVTSCKIRPATKRYVYFVESSPEDQLQPKLHNREYYKPGDERQFKIPAIYSVDGSSSFIPSTALFAEQYSLSNPKWNSDSKGVTFEFNQRGHKIYRVLELSAEDGTVRPLIEESADKYIAYSRAFRHDLDDGKHIIWASERDNWNHLYMYNRENPSDIKQITKGEWYVRSVVKVDEKNRQIYFTANGVDKKVDPYLISYYKIGFDGDNLTCLTPDKGNHTAWFSADMNYLVDSYSMVDKAPVAAVIDAKSGKIVMELEKADISELEKTGWKAPEVFTAKGRDDKTDMWGVIIRPSNFDPNKKYPVVEYIYQGPGGQYVPKSFISYNHNMTAIAELGFIVVMVDGMSTSFRSREFENVCYQNLKDAGFPDHIKWIKAAAKKYPYMDSDNVGIFGCSAGGQEALAAVLFHPEFYKAAYSACGCHDNRMDKIWWNEQWMGYPIGDQYSKSSNVDNAYRLTRPLMILVGEMDDNVDPSSTMQVVNRLVKAHIDFELVVIPGAGHTMGDDFGEHKRFDFFVRNLHGVNPPKWEDIKR